jgi:hypothetical protein
VFNGAVAVISYSATVKIASIVSSNSVVGKQTLG